MKERFKLIPAVYLLLRRENEVLLLRRANTGYQDGRYSLIAGHLEGDEAAKEAMIREAKEEAGISVDSEHLQFIHLAHRLTRNQPGQERLDMFFECWEWQGEVKNNEPDKCDELKWYLINDLPMETLPFIKLVLKNVINGVNYSEYTVEPK